MPAVDVNVQTQARLQQLENATNQSSAVLLEEAVKQLHRSWMGRDDGGPTISTGPFRKLYRDRWAEVVIRQVDPTQFDLVEPFRYSYSGSKFTVPANVNVTDLASIPRPLMWLVPRYGRHTLAALLHDHLQHVDDVTPAQADSTFRDAMGQTGVPLVRRWIMWAAVTLRSRLKFEKLVSRRLTTGVYAALFFLVGLLVWPVLLVAALRGWFGAWEAALCLSAVLLSPLVLCWLWMRSWRFGLVCGYALLIVIFPAAIVCLVLLIYVVIETAAKLFDENPQPILTSNLPGDSTAQGNPNDDDF